jgi:hypothetical protein
MPDLTLHEYRDYSEMELRRILRAEAMKIKGADMRLKNEVIWPLADHGGRRSGVERRQFSYISHLPERRSGQDRRTGKDRRSAFDRRNSMILDTYDFFSPKSQPS